MLIRKNCTQPIAIQIKPISTDLPETIEYIEILFAERKYELETMFTLEIITLYEIFNY